MNKIFPLNVFSEQFFPDVTLESVKLSPTTLEIGVSESEWGLQSDIILFYGPGTMTFTYSGPARIRRQTHDGEWEYLQTVNILEHISLFEMVSRKDPYYIFRFRLKDTGQITEILLETLEHIFWSGEGEDMDDDA